LGHLRISPNSSFLAVIFVIPDAEALPLFAIMTIGSDFCADNGGPKRIPAHANPAIRASREAAFFRFILRSSQNV
jgi:hypothetical protein